MSRLSRGTNVIYGSLTLAGVVAVMLLLRRDDGGLAAAGAIVLTAGVVIAWVIQTIIDYRAAKRPLKPMTTDDIAHYQRNRIFVAIGLFLFIVLPILLSQ